MSAGEGLYCTFFIAEQFYGIPVQDVQEVLQAQLMTRAPLAPPDEPPRHWCVHEWHRALDELFFPPTS